MLINSLNLENNPFKRSLEFMAEEDERDPDYLIKIVLVGDSGVGKTNLLLRWAHGSFNKESIPTIGVEFATKTIEIDGKLAKVQIWDTAGQERYRAITSAYYRGAVGALLVYDVASISTFNNVTRWLEEIRENSEEDMVCILIGNKSDLEEQRTVPTEEGISFSKKEKIMFMETSAKHDIHIDEAFETLVKEIVSNISKTSIKSQDSITASKPSGILLTANEEDGNLEQKLNQCC